MRRHLIHIHSAELVDGQPKIPPVSEVEHGELVVNYAADSETIMLKNSNDEIAHFKTDDYYQSQFDELRSLVEEGGFGEQGPQGSPQGNSGQDGVNGQQGPQGAPGKDGVDGEQGPQGPQGSQGPKGNDGTGVNIKGSVDSADELPQTGNTNGDGYIVNGNLHVWDGTQWNDVGKIQGPQGLRREIPDRTA